MSGPSADAKTHELLIKIKTQRPPWDGDRLKATPKDKYVRLKRFITKCHRTLNGAVAFDDIDRFISSVGDIEPDWHALLHICQKNDLADRYLWSADYWGNSSRKEGVSFVALDDHLLITRGLYKTALARYALHYYGADALCGVKVSRWSVDWEMYGIWLELKEVCAERFPHFVVKPERKRVSSSREEHSVIDEYLLTLRREDKRSGEVTRMGRVSAKDWLEDLTDDEGAAYFDLEDLKAFALAA